MSNLSNNDWWGGEDLPTSNELHAVLEHGMSCCVRGHSLIPDEHGVWITNPYGVDGLWQDLSMQHVEDFLTVMRKGEDYGTVP